MKLITRVLVFAVAIYATYALCNTCSAVTGLACVANDHFEVCVNGIPTAPAIQCPTGTVCTADARVCTPQGSVQPSCSRCRTCSTVNSFACLSNQTFAICVGNVVLDSINFTCSGELVCNIDATELCVDPTVTGIGSSCPSVSTGTTTPAPTTPDPTVDPQGYCASVAVSGRYEITSDPNCKQYIYCIQLNSTWIGNVYECVGTTFFNATSRLCGIEVPTRCA